MSLSAGRKTPEQRRRRRSDGAALRTGPGRGCRAPAAAQQARGPDSGAALPGPEEDEEKRASLSRHGRGSAPLPRSTKERKRN